MIHMLSVIRCTTSSTGHWGPAEGQLKRREDSPTVQVGAQGPRSACGGSRPRSGRTLGRTRRGNEDSQLLLGDKSGEVLEGPVVGPFRGIGEATTGKLSAPEVIADAVAADALAGARLVATVAGLPVLLLFAFHRTLPGHVSKDNGTIPRLRIRPTRICSAILARLVVAVNRQGSLLPRDCRPKNLWATWRVRLRPSARGRGTHL
jgi:hypothetical protein